MPKNRALIIITAIVAVIVVALAIFYFFFMREAPSDTGGINLPIDEGTLPGSETGDGGTGGLPIDSGSSGSGGTLPNTSGSMNQPKAFQTLRLISSLPVAGATFLERNAETLIRYVERGSGHIFQTSAASTEAPKKVSNTTIPKIYEALWNQKGQGFILRYLKGEAVQSYYASLGQSASSTEELEPRNGAFLPIGIDSITVSPSGERIFYIHTADASNTYGTVADPDGSAKNQLFKSPASEWAAHWGSDNSILLYTKPSAYALGAAYLLNVRSGAQSKLIGDVPGFSGILNADATLMLYAQSTANSVALSLYSIATRTSAPMSLRTIPEKCVWSRLEKSTVYCAAPITPPVGIYPDNWYQGTLSFIDQIVKLNTKTGESTVILVPESLAKQSMDITHITLNEKEDKLLFINKKDLSLWLLDLSEEE